MPMGGSGLFGPSQSTVTVPPPSPVFPGIQGQYLNTLGGAGGVGQNATGGLNSLISTGNPTDVGPAFQALVAAQTPLNRQGQQNINEQFGAMGLRNSSALGTATGNYQSQIQTNFLNILSQYTLQSQEAAAGRQASATMFGEGLFSGAGMTDYQSKVPVTGPSPYAQGTSALSTIAMMMAMGGM